MKVGTLEIEMLANMARLKKDMDEAKGHVASAANAIEKSVERIKLAFASLGVGVGLQQIMALTDQYTKYTSQLKLATAGQHEYNQALEDVRRISKAAQADIAATGVLYARITNATRELGASQKQVANLTEVVSLSLKASAATSAESSSAMLQLSQAFASGKLRGEEFNAVNEAAPRLMKALADGMGVPIGALKEMATAGKITTEVMAQALPRALEELRKEAAQVQTIAGAFQVLKNNLLEFVGAQAQSSGSAAMLSNSIMFLADNLRTIFAVLTGITAMKASQWFLSVATAAYGKAQAVLAAVAATKAEQEANAAAARTEVVRAASTLEFITAERARVVAQMQAAQATMAATAALGAQSYALRLNTEATAANAAAIATLAQLGKMQAATTAAMTAGQAALSAATTGAGTAATLASRAIGLLGGPIGWITTLIGLGVTAWSLWGAASKKGEEDATTSLKQSTPEIIAMLKAQTDALDKRNAARNAMSAATRAGASEEVTNRAAEISEQIRRIHAQEGEWANTSLENRIAVMKALGKSYAQLIGAVDGLAAAKEREARIGQQPKIDEWMIKYGTNAEKLAAKLKEIEKDIGGPLPDELRKRVEQEFNADALKKAADERKKLQEMDLKSWGEYHDALEDQRVEQGQIALRQLRERNQAEERLMKEHLKGMFEAIDALREEEEKNLQALGKLQPSHHELSDKALSEIDKFLDPARAKTFGEALSDAFGNAGQSLGQLIKAMGDYRHEQALIGAERKKLDAINDPDKRAAREMALSKQQTRSQLSAYGDMTQAAAGFFDKQSRGYKALMAASKVFHAAELAMTLAELVPKAIGAVLNQGNGDPYTAFARMAAMAAIVAGLGVAIGGGGGGGSVVGAKERQEAAGTGSVLGDATAKSESLARSMELLTKTGLIGNEYMSAMVRSLRAIETNIGGLASLVVRTSGLLGGKGDLEGLNLGLQSRGFLGLGRSSSELTDQGIMIAAQTVGQARQGFTGNQYSDVTTSGRTWYGRSYSNTNRVTGMLSGDLANQFTRIVDNLANAILGAAQVLGGNRNSVLELLNNFNIAALDISLKGLKGDEIEEQLQAIFGKLGDDMAASVFPWLGKLQQVGEGMFETLMRLAQEYAATDAIAKMLGKDAVKAFGELGEASVAARDDLVQLMGGIEAMSESVKKYFDLFYTDAEKNTQAAAALEYQFAQLGIQMPGSIAAFRQLVEAQDLSTEAGRQMFAALIEIAPAFHSVATAATGMINTMGGLLQSIYGGVYGRQIAQSAFDNAANAWNAYLASHGIGTAGYTAAMTYQDLLNNPSLAAGVYEMVQNGSLSTQAGSLFNTVLQAFQALQQAIGTPGSGTTGAITDFGQTAAQIAAQLAQAKGNLSAYLRGSLLSDNSPLTPMQKYLEAKAQFDSMAILAGNNDLNAIAGLGGARDTFLKFSELLNASGPGFIADWMRSFDVVNAIGGNTVDRPYSIAVAQELHAEYMEELTATREELAQVKLATAALLERAMGDGVKTQSPATDQKLDELKNEIAGRQRV